MKKIKHLKQMNYLFLKYITERKLDCYPYVPDRSVTRQMCHNVKFNIFSILPVQKLNGWIAVL